MEEIGLPTSNLAERPEFAVDAEPVEALRVRHGVVVREDVDEVGVIALDRTRQFSGVSSDAALTVRDALYRLNVEDDHDSAFTHPAHYCGSSGVEVIAASTAASSADVAAIAPTSDRNATISRRNSLIRRDW